LSTTTGAPHAESASPIATAAVWALALLAALFMVWPVWRAALPLEVLRGEGWGAYHTDAAFTRGLYPPPDGLVANNYPPLWYYLVRALSLVFGDALYVGRALSLASLGVLALAVAWIVRHFGFGRAAAALGALWFVATMARFFDLYVGMNEPQLPALALMSAGLAWFLARKAAGKAVEPAVLLMVLAGFVKHNTLALPVVALLWLARDDWRLGLRAAITGAAASAIGLAILAYAYPHFLADMFLPRTYHIGRALDAIGRLQFVLPALVLWGIWVRAERAVPAVRFSAWLIAAGLLSYLLQKAGAGVDENVQIELVFATAVGIGMAFERLPLVAASSGWAPRRVGILVLAVLVVRLLASTRFEPAYVLASPSYRALGAEHAAIARFEAARIAAFPTPVACSNMMVCRMAGKALVYDHFKVIQMLDTRTYSHGEIAAKILAARLVFETIDERTRAASLYRRYPAD
jgi:hypothetical protein